MIGMRFDAASNLVRFAAVPPPFVQAPRGATAPDWSELFRAAGIDPRALKPAEPRAVVGGEQVAWTFAKGAKPQRVEASSLAGRPIYFEVLADGLPAARAKEPRRSLALAVGLLVVLITITILSRRNLRLRRGDRSGATRIALAVGISLMIAWLFGAHHVATRHEIALLLEGLAYASLLGVLTWNGYIALEPAARRRWPHALVGWTRLLSGQVRDPRVGRDVLIGVAASCLMNALTLILPSKELLVVWANAMTSMPLALAEVASSFSRVVADVLIPIILFLLLRLVLRRDLLAAAVYVAVFTAVTARTPLAVAVMAACGVIMIGVLLRFGALALAAFTAGNAVLTVLPVVWPVEPWYAGATILGVAIIVGLAAWGFLVSLAGRPIFQGDLIEV